MHTPLPFLPLFEKINGWLLAYIFVVCINLYYQAMGNTYPDIKKESRKSPYSFDLDKWIGSLIAVS